MCDCPNQTFTDGGDDYQRVGGNVIGFIQIVDPSGQVSPNADGYIQPRLEGF